MKDLISRRDAIDAVSRGCQELRGVFSRCEENILTLPSVQPTLRERALMLLVNWAEECGFGYDNFPEEYERYKDEIVGMNYIDGMIYIAEKEVESNE